MLARARGRRYHILMNNGSKNIPFAELGSALQSLRKSISESVAEAAGAVEIAEEELLQIEQGIQRPSEEILLLLINHFGTKEDEAVRLWEMAGYDASNDDQQHIHDDHDPEITKTVVMAISMDPRIMYSDSVQVNGNKHGVVLSFMQPGGGNIPAMPISRIGMSREQASKLVSVLQDTLLQLDAAEKPRQLPHGDSRKSDRSRKDT